MSTRARISKLLDYAGLPWPSDGTLHDLLDMVDTQLSVDTRTLGALECDCLWHVGKCCKAVRQLGARVALLEEAVARDQFEQNIERFRLSDGRKMTVIRGGTFSTA